MKRLGRENKSLLKTTIRIAYTVMMVGATACAPYQKDAEIHSGNLSSENIVGGEAVTENDAFIKTTVGIAHEGQGVICTGSLISKNLVVTAGHCVMDIDNPSLLYVTFGNDLSSKNLQKRRVLGGRVPAKWPQLGRNQDKDWSDIALLKIEGEAPAGFEAAVILGNKAALKDNLDVTIAGFGLLNMVPQKASDLMQKVVIKLTNSNYAESEILFNQQDGKGACHGDSGGPALITIKGRAVLIGVTSRSATLKGGLTCLEGSIYTSVASHIAFLRQAARDLNSKNFKAGEAIPGPRL